MNPAPAQPIRQSRRRGSVGRWFSGGSGAGDMGASLAGVDDECEAGEQGGYQLRPEAGCRDHPGLAAAAVTDQFRFERVLTAVEDPVFSNPGDEKVELDVPLQVFCRVPGHQDFGDQDWAELVPLGAAECLLPGQVVVTREV